MTDGQSVKSAKIRILPDGLILPADAQHSLLELLLKNKIDIGHSCGGMGSCGTCRVLIEEGLELMGPRSEVESELAKEYGYAPEERLSCQNQAVAGIALRLPGSRLADEEGI